MSNILVLESSKMYRETVQNLYVSIEEDNEDWIFFEDEKTLKKSAVLDVVNSLFSLDFESRKIQKTVIEDLYKLSMSEDYFVRTQKILSDLEAYYYELEWEMPYNAKVEISDFRSVLKAGITGVVASYELMERVHDYIKISARLLNSKVIILVGMQEYFEEKEWRQLEETAIYEGLYLLDIEKSMSFNCGNKVIIDFDGCRVV